MTDQSASSASSASTPDASRHHTALFANLVIQQTNMALIFLGQAPHPQTGTTETDVEAASVFIDTLDMLAAKTKGNLSKSENDLLQQSLTNLRMAFVEAADAAPSKPSPPAPAAADAPKDSPPAPSAAPSDTAPEDDPRKKFVKKY